MKKIKRLPPRSVFFVSLLFAVAMAFVAADAVRSDQLAVHFFDVGQGDAIYIETPQDYRILIDGGSSGSTVARHLGREIPFYSRRIDMVVVTHMDADHVGGLIDVVTRFDVGTILVGEVVSNTELAKTFWEAVRAKNIPTFVVEAGDRFTFDGGITLLVLAPTEQLRGGDDNNASVTTKLTYQNDTFLFTGDLERQGEAALVNNNIDVRADVLKVGHHGSNTSTSAWFLKRVAPSLAIIQVGKNNYGHPHVAVLERLADIPTLRNDHSGTISLFSRGDTF